MSSADLHHAPAPGAAGWTPGELTSLVERLAPVLARRPEGVFARLALTAGAYVEFGASPVALAENVPACTGMTLLLRKAFSEVWPAVNGDGRPEPNPDDPPRMRNLVKLFEDGAARAGIPAEAAPHVAVSWFDAPHWVNLLITLLGRREFRDAMEPLAGLAEDAAELADRVPRAYWLGGLFAVLDDEPVVVLDPASGRGFRLTMSGVGDNFQLHTLLADRLIGDGEGGLLAGVRPEAAWVAAATDAPAEVAGKPIERRFRLFDATGEYVAPEGRPSEIARVEGARVLVIHPPNGSYQWGRAASTRACARS
ncbi:hypothetical protein [Actinoplanes sp. NPDC051411]|uniref:hypothetical protein n=1 Tax=Actinoplanes sp. NPDC051411 TaxID=3155522 RepID=UPI003416AEFA